MATGLFSGWAARDYSGRANADMTSARAAAKAAEAQTEVELMRADVERLLMITEALWSILKEQHGYTDEELMRRVEEIDLRDGKTDGKVAKQLQPLCPNCNRTLTHNLPRCMYCGTEIQRELFGR